MAHFQGTYDIEYDDGDKEAGVSPEFIHHESGAVDSGSEGMDPSDEKALLRAFRNKDKQNIGEIRARDFKSVCTEQFKLVLGRDDLDEIQSVHPGEDNGYINYRGWIKAIVASSAAMRGAKRARAREMGSDDENGRKDSDEEAHGDPKLVVLTPAVRQLIFTKCTDYDEAYDAFRPFDTEASGEISDVGFGKGLKKLGVKVTDEQLNELVTLFDFDGGGLVRYKEFIRFALGGVHIIDKDFAAVMNKVRLQRLKIAAEASKKKRKFDLLKSLADHDDDEVGWIKAKEFRTCLKKMKFELGNDDIETICDGVEVPDKKGGKKPKTKGRIDYRAFAELALEDVVDLDIVQCRLASAMLLARRKRIKLVKAFEAQDKHRKGVVMRDVFEHILLQGLSLPLTSEDIVVLMAKFAAKKRVEYGEFLAWMEATGGRNTRIAKQRAALGKSVKAAIRKLRKKNKKWNLEKVFRRFDAGGRGSISRVDFLRGLEKSGLAEQLGAGEAREIIELFDPDRRNSVDYQGFEKFAGGNDDMVRGESEGNDSDSNDDLSANRHNRDRSKNRHEDSSDDDGEKEANKRTQCPSSLFCVVFIYETTLNKREPRDCHVLDR